MTARHPASLEHQTRGQKVARVPSAWVCTRVRACAQGLGSVGVMAINPLVESRLKRVLLDILVAT